MKKRKIIFGVVIGCLIIIGCFLYYHFNTAEQPLATTPVEQNENFVEIPQDSSTPKDYTPEDNISICQNVIGNMRQWSSKTEGTAKANVLFIDYTQNISASKIIKDGNATQQSASISSLLGTGQQRYFQDGAILIRKADKVKSVDNIEWEKEFTPISEETYAQNYGKTPFALTNYIINDETILSSKQLDSEKNTYKYEYELDTEKSIEYYKRQMRNEAGSSDYPTFNKIVVTVTMDEQWRPLEIHYSENYNISIPVIGDVTCQGEITETFSDFGQVGELLNNSEVSDYMENEYDPNNLSELEEETIDIGEYVTDIFTNQPYYNIKLSTGDTSIQLNTYVDIKNGIIKLKNDKVFAAYADKKLYLKAGNIKLSCQTDSLLDAIAVVISAVNPKADTSSLNTLKSMDFKNMNVDEDILNGLTNQMVMETSDTDMTIKLNTDGLDAYIHTNIDEEKNIFLDKANLSFDTNGTDITINVTQGKKVSFDGLDKFNDITKATEFVKPWTQTITSKGIGVNLSAAVGDTKIKGQAVIGYQPFQASFTTNIQGIPLKAVVLKKYIYLESGKIKVRCKQDNLEETVKYVLGVMNIDMSKKSDKFIPKCYTKLISQIQKGNIDIEKLINSVKKVKYKNGKLIIKTKQGKDTVKIKIGKDTLSVSGITLAKEKLSVKAEINKKYKKNPNITVDNKAYVKASKIVDLAKAYKIKKIAKAKGISFDTNISLGKEQYQAHINIAKQKKPVVSVMTNIQGVDLQVVYLKKKFYVSSGNIYIRCKTKNLEKALSYVLELVNARGKIVNKEDIVNSLAHLMQTVSNPDIDIAEIINSITDFKYKKGTLNIGVGVSGNPIRVAINKKAIYIDGVKIKDNLINASVYNVKIRKKQPSIKVDDSQYVRTMHVISLFKKANAKELIASNGIILDTSFYAAGYHLTGIATLSYGDDFQMEYDTTIQDVAVSIIYKKNRVYVKAGKIKIKSSIDALYQTVLSVLKDSGVDVSNIVKEESKSFAQAFENVWNNYKDKIILSDIVNNIKTLKCDRKNLIVEYKNNQDMISIVLEQESLNVKSATILNGFNVKLKINKIFADSPFIDVDDNAYSQLKDILSVLDEFGIKNLVTAQGLDTDVSIKVGEKMLDANIKLDYASPVKAQIETAVTIEGQPVKITLKYIEDVVYLSVDSLKLQCKKEDLNSVLQQAFKFLNVDEDAVNQIVESLGSIQFDVSFKEVIENVEEFSCDENVLKLSYKVDDTVIHLEIEDKTIEISGLEMEGSKLSAEATIHSTASQNITIDAEEYIDIKPIFDAIGVKVDDSVNLNSLKQLFSGKAAVQLETTIDGKHLSIVYESNNVYADYNGLKIKANDGTVASIADAIFKIYGIDISKALEVLAIKEDINDINLSMFEQYADIDSVTESIENIELADILEIIDNIAIIEEEMNVKLNDSILQGNILIYNSNQVSKLPEDEAAYIDFGTIDQLLRSFGQTAENLSFDVKADANLALNLGIMKFDLEKVPLTAKIKVEKDGVYGNVHADVPFMSGITNANFDVPENTKETINISSKEKTEISTSYKIVSDSQTISSNLYILPNSVYMHKQITYKYEKTVTTTKYKKVFIWIPQNTSKETAIVTEEKDYYEKCTYSQFMDNMFANLGFVLNMPDNIIDAMISSSEKTDTSSAALEDILKGYSLDETASKYNFVLDVSGITNGAIGTTNVSLVENEEGYLNKLNADCKIYSILGLNLDADLINIGKTVDIGFNPDELVKDNNY